MTKALEVAMKRPPRCQRRIAADLTRRIIDGESPLGSSLPSEQRLAAHYGHARGTVRGALNRLSSQGMITPRHGSGWLITSTLQQQSFTHVRSFAQWAHSKGMRPGGRVISSTKSRATPVQARAFRLRSAEEVLHVIRVRSLDSREVMLERTVYAPWVANAVETIPDDETPVVQVLAEKWGIETGHAEHSIDAVAASSEDARLLSIRRSSPLLRVRRSSFAQDGRPIDNGSGHSQRLPSPFPRRRVGVLIIIRACSLRSEPVHRRAEEHIRPVACSCAVRPGGRQPTEVLWRNNHVRPARLRSRCTHAVSNTV